jgi:hypothetical protein
MALLIPSFPDPRDKANPLVDVYAWISGLSLDLFSNQGQVVFNVNPNAASWQDRPVDQFGIALGQVLGPGPEGGPPATFPTLAEFMADPEFAAAFAVIGAKLYAAALATHPAFAGAVEV